MRDRVLILAGGTGGHIYPALAVAEVLRREGVGLRWLGARGGMEERLVPRHDIAIETLRVSGLRGRGVLGWMLAPLMVLKATLQAIAAIRRFKPGVVLGMGGFVSGPGGLAAFLCRKPLVIHEQNAVPGLTNRVLALLANRVLEAYPGCFGRHGIETGNPVRAAIVALSDLQRLPPQDRKLRLLVVGGSRGARRLNEVLPAALAACAPFVLEVWHQTGEAGLAMTRDAYASREMAARVDAFIDDMPAAYAWADFIVCRSGAMTLAEITAAGLPSVLVPFPHAVDDHQTANARYLAEAGAAMLVPESELTPASLAGLLRELMGDSARLADMGARARRLARPAAAAQVAGHCLELLRA